MTQPTAPASLYGECAFLHKQVDWLCGRPWIDEFYTEIRTLARDLSTAIGYPWPRPLDCPQCERPVWLPTDGLESIEVIKCGSCGAQWEKRKWLWLAGVVESEAG